MKRILFFAVLFPVPFVLSGQRTLSQRVAGYDIRVRLDTEAKTLSGTAVLDWANTSSDTVAELQFHLYMNAFRNTRSTFMAVSGGQLRGIGPGKSDPEIWGWTDIHRMAVTGGEDLTEHIRYYQPDDGNADDRTVIRVPLSTPVTGGQKLRVEIDFTTKLPKVFARAGYSRDFFLVAQWFPKLGVYEPAGMRYAEKGGWNCHQYHPHSEFYANFGVYRVAITLPPEYIVGATGQRIDSVMNADSSQTLTFLARDVVDFAWTASPHYRVFDDQWNDVRIRLLMYPGHEAQAERHLFALKAALDYFSEALEPYPYPSVTVVVPPFHAMGAGGMEYPMFFTSGTVKGIPAGLRLPEMLTVHEFGHNYFMGILATNEFEEAWMDEGMNTWFEGRIMDRTWGPDRSLYHFGKVKAGDGESQRLRYTQVPNPSIAEITRPAWEFRHGGYGFLSYNKTAVMLMTMERLLGKPTMDEIMRTYYRRWKFRHPCGRDFIDIVNEVVQKNHGSRFGENMDWFFDQVLYGSGVCDYKLDRVSVSKVLPPRGVHEVNGSRVTYKSLEYEENLFHSRVIVHRLGEVIMPLEVKVFFDNGDVVTEKWDGRERTTEFSYQRPEKAIAAVVDPENKLLIDINRQNNSYALQPKKGIFRKWSLSLLFALQNMFHCFTLAFA